MLYIHIPSHYWASASQYMMDLLDGLTKVSIRYDRRQLTYVDGSLLTLTEAIDCNQLQSASVTITLLLYHRGITLLKAVKGGKAVIRQKA